MDQTTIALLLGAAIFALAYVVRNFLKSFGWPPGPRPLPIIGNLLSIRTRDYIAFTKWKSVYGPINTMYLGSRRAILLNDYDVIHEAFVGNADAFTGRPSNEFFKNLSHNSGIIFKDGSVWQEHRRFVLRILRDLGAGRQLGEQIVSEECLALKEKLENSLGRPYEPQALFTASINNVIARFSFGQRCGTDDPDFKKYAANMEKIASLNFIDRLPSFLPFILKIKPLYQLYRCFSRFPDVLDEMHDFIINKIEQHRRDLNSMGSLPTSVEEAMDVCDAQLIEQAKQEAATPGNHTFTKWQVIRNLFELFFAGTETTSSTLNWITALLSTHQDVLKRVQREIEVVIGRDRIPSMSDRTQMPYMCAVIDEVLRYSSLVTGNVPHRTTAAVKLSGFIIPEDTIIWSNLYGVHRDPTKWAKPYEFFPEHFLSEDGRYKPSKYLIPFSMGKRACLGEFLARMEIFLLATTLFQSFSVRLEDPNTDVEALLAGRPTGFRKPLEHAIVFSKIDE